MAEKAKKCCRHIGGFTVTRDPVYDAMKEHSKDKFDHDRKMFMERAKVADDGQWNKHTEFHWSRMVGNHKLDFWPSRNKFQYRGKIRRGNVYEFIKGKK